MTHVDAQISALVSGLSHASIWSGTYTSAEDHSKEESAKELAKKYPDKAVTNADSFGYFVAEYPPILRQQATVVHLPPSPCPAHRRGMSMHAT